MKKFIVFCMLCIFLFTASLFKQEYDFSDINNLSVQVFTSDDSFSQFNKYSSIKNGDGRIFFCDYDQYKQIKKQCTSVSGVTFIFKGDNDLYNKIKYDLKINVIENSETNFVGYSNYFDNCVNYNDKKVNVQGYFDGEKIYIGTPLLLGSY